MHTRRFFPALVLCAACAADDHDSSTPGKDPVGQGSSITEGLHQSDAEHAAAIRQALLDDGDLSAAAQNVTVMAESGAVTLSGEVPTAAERERVERIAEDCNGTTSVVNKITVEPR